MLAQRGTGGRVLRAACSNYRSLLYRGQMTPSSLGCPEFEPAALHTLLRHEATEIAYLPAATGETTDCAANVSSLDSMAITDGTGGYGGPAEALQRSVCALLLR
jgi:hypothetical protein